MKAYGKCLFFSDLYSKENALVLGSGSGKHEDPDVTQDLGFFFVRNNQQALQKGKYTKNLELSQQRPSKVKWGQWKVLSQ